MSQVVLEKQELYRKELKEKLDQLRNIIQYTSGAVSGCEEIVGTPPIKEAIQKMYQDSIDSGALVGMTSPIEKDLIEKLGLKTR